MKLLVDIGNSRVKWASAGPDGLADSGEAVHRGQAPEAALSALLASAVQPDEVRVANVAGDRIGGPIVALLAAHFGQPVVVARTPATAGPLQNGYHQPRQLGIDRWLALCAAYERRPGALVLVDAGTALTIDAVAADGHHAGGLIVPGLALMQAALRSETGDLDRYAGEVIPAGASPGGGFGRDTAAGIEAGTMLALTCLVERCVETFRASVPGAALFLTGGDAELLAARLGLPAELVPALVLEGLALEPRRFDVV